MTENEKLIERVILVAVNTGDDRETLESVDELEQLAETAGAITVGRVIQNREHVEPGTYLGSGKIFEVQCMVQELGATGVICDDELTPAQMANLEDRLQCKVMDRTLLILDIFAGRASSSEGKLQVELAQLQYRLSRLTGLGRSLSRLGGGIGTRGPGEKKLEMDRRLIKDRISSLRASLKEVEKHRELLRDSRRKKSLPVVAIVGYTNAGKSTLLNKLTGAGVLEEDQLFATLDPTTRVLALEGGQEILLTDTVGFIRKLPHNLIDAFHSTLEEAKYADLILHVVDASSPQMERQMEVVYDTLKQLDVKNTTIITLFNKQDKAEDPVRLRDAAADKSIAISARTGLGLDEVLEALEEEVTKNQILIERVYTYDDAGKIALIRKYGQLLKEEYEADGIHVRALIPKEIYGSCG